MRRIINVLLIMSMLLSYIQPAYGETVIEKYFHEMTQSEKERVLSGLIDDGVVPNSITANDKRQSLNSSNWYNLGVVTYGDIAVVNAENQNTSHPNYKDGQWRYLGYDMNGGLYGNDSFPPDYPSSMPPENKNWIKTDTVKKNSVARALIGESTVIGDSRFSNVDKLRTIAAFLDNNPGWVSKGRIEDYILDHFFFNAVTSVNGLTQGQFVGVHDIGGGVLRYQTFSVQVKVKFVIPPEMPVEVPGTPPNDEPGESEEQEPPEIPPEEDEYLGVNCELFLPEHTYETHKVLAEDKSEFFLGENIYPAIYVYSEGLGSNSFKTIGGSGSVARIKSTEAEVSFRQTGFHQVQLKASAKNGGTGTDTKTIEVKKTPAIQGTLGGVQKQNRKQSLIVNVAKRTDVTIDSFWIKIESLDENREEDETVVLTHDTQNPSANTLTNGPTIKTRPVETLSPPGRPGEYISCRLDFLTKNTEEVNYKYTIFVKDSRGETDLVSRVFSVAPDRPPDAEISMDGSFIRNQASDVARIVAEDVSSTDGDQIERTWFFRAFSGQNPAGDWIPLSAGSLGYEDLSFGSGKKIAFDKVGVGPFQVKLLAKDMWVEETLPEYINADDVLSASAESVSEVQNVPPIVSIKPLKTKTASLTFLAGGDYEYGKLLNERKNIERELLQKGIGADITIEKMQKVCQGPTGNGAEKTLEVRTPYGYQAQWLFYAGDNFICDDENLYKIDATWPGNEPDEYPEPPYTISAWDFETPGTQNTKWTFSFNDSLLSVGPARTGPYFAQDDTGKYLYFISKGKTLILSKDNGTFLTVLDSEVGQNIFVEADNIFMFKPDGIYRISTRNGLITKVYSGKIMEGKLRRLGGEIHFLLAVGNDFRYRGRFDPVTQKVKLEDFHMAETEPGIAGHKILGIDVDGKIIIKTANQKANPDTGNLYNTYDYSIGIYSRENRLISAGPVDTGSQPVWTDAVVYDEGGVCNYIAYTKETSSSTKCNHHIRIFDINTGEVHSDNLSGKKNPNGLSLTDSENILFSREINGEIFVLTASEFYWVWGAPNPYNVYSQRVKSFIYNKAAKTFRMGDDYGELGIDVNTLRYGTGSDYMGALQIGYGDPNAAFSLTMLIRWDQNLEQILKRSINKYVKNDKDINLTFVYDETNSPSIYTSEILNSNGLILLQGAEITGETISDLVAESPLAESRILNISAQADGELTKNYKLEANKTYYYEYEIKASDGSGDIPGDIFALDHKIGQTSGALFSGENYFTAESFVEDFKDPENLNPFFALDRNYIEYGYYKGAEVFKTNQTVYRTDPIPADKTKISFTVPEGKTGLLSLDYFHDRLDQAYVRQGYIRIDGEIWKAFEEGGGNGRYSHPELLGPGEHSLTFFTSANSSGDTGKMWLKKIRVDLFGDTGEPLPISVKGEGVPTSPAENGYYKIQGNFTTLPDVISYGEVSNVEIISTDLLSDGPYTSEKSPKTNGEQFTFSLPSGKMALAGFLDVLSRPKFDAGSTTKNYGITYSLKYPGTKAVRTWMSYVDNNYNLSSIIMRNIGEQEQCIITGPMYEGTSTWESKGSKTKSALGYFRYFTAVISDAQNEPWGELSHFYTGLKEEGAKYFLEKERYESSDICLRFPQEGEFKIRNFRLYYLYKGAKIYVEKEAFANSETLSHWKADKINAELLVEENNMEEDPDERTLVYKKGELIVQKVNYWDYEDDPSKKEYWKYTHLPFNDGLHPESGLVLDAPIDRFYIDGKYLVEHWQEDNTSRPPVPGGNPEYDKVSNVAEFVFYVEGGGSVPWVESIKTLPASLKEGDMYKLEVLVNDSLKQELALTTELYKGGELIYVHEKTNINVDSSGKYPPVITGLVPEAAEAGNYEVVCVVRSQTGVGLGTYRFSVVSEGKITGMVNHTSQWDTNRKTYNLSYFDEEVNRRFTYGEYINMSPPRKRGTNVFWSGERFVLEAHAAGNPMNVTAEIQDLPGYNATLDSSGRKNEKGEWIYEGELWDRSMLNKWGKGSPIELTFVFTAEYGGGVNKTFEEKVIVDSNVDYWLLHRVW